MSNELVVIEEAKVLDVFSSDNGLDFIVQEAKELVSGFEHDLSTAAGRKRTASLANKVAKLKVRLDNMGKNLTSDWKAKSKAVDANRKAMRDELDKLKVDARKPLTDWEEEQERLAEEKRLAEEAEKQRIQMEADHEIALLMNREFDREAEEARKAEEEAERLRKEEEEKARILREEQLKREAAEQARLEAERKAKEEAERIEREKQEAIEREAEAKRKAEQAERDRIAAEERAKIQAEQAEIRRKQEAEDAERKRLADIEVAKQAEIARQKAEEERKRKEQEAREANRKHVGAIRKAAKESLMSLNIDEQTAKEIVLAISNGKIANVTINY